MKQNTHNLNSGSVGYTEDTLLVSCWFCIVTWSRLIRPYRNVKHRVMALILVISLSHSLNDPFVQTFQSVLHLPLV